MTNNTDRAQAHSASERGAVVIQVAVSLLILLALTSFVLDYGVMWASRGQAQTAADAGALAGAISLAFDSPSDFDAAKARAQAMAKANGVWGQAPDVQLTDVTFPPPAICKPPAYPGLPDTCVKVDVFRNQLRNNPLPMFFGNLVGVADQGVRATATAQIVAADTTDCLKPWAVVDRWAEFGPEGFTPTSTFDKYSDGKGNNPPPEPDFYAPATPDSPGTGFRLPDDQGLRYAIKTGAPGSSAVSSGWFRSLDLPRADTNNMGGASYQDNILSCNGLPSTYASPETVCPTSIVGRDEAIYWAARGCYRTQPGVGSTSNSIDDLVARDSGASWKVGEGIVGSSYSPPTKSPRVVPIGVMDIDWYLSQDPTGQNGILRLVNIYGFFIEGMGDVDKQGNIIFPAKNGQAVIGRIMTIPATGSSTLTSTASFLNSIILVR